ncbi:MULTISPECIES: stimulus-sensing domain-containing protein [unclassified Iodidimonas]|uniref:sensor histidine kinase n=1 Tax=unclassified Iodidimonas TaxID=2626145 RepID=UPI0024828547|nr:MULTISPECIES: stimulus-sensing domain-containing protein [unclassified Iodidimonas]
MGEGGRRKTAASRKDDPSSDDQPPLVQKRQRRRWRWPISPLMLRIMAVNLIALMSIVGGIFYLTEFRQTLIDRRMDQLRVQAEILAGAIGEAATAGPESSSINEPDARLIIARLVGPSEIRARLFGIEGQLMVDSRFLAGSQSVVAEILPPLGREKSLRENMLDQLNDLLDLVADRPMVPLYHESPTQQAGDYIEVLSALSGEPDRQIRALDGGPLLLSAAFPVQRFRRVLGALMVSADTSDIESIVRSEQIMILKVSAASLAATLLLSIFLASTIARPVRQLARAAEKVRNGIGREKRLPRFDRNDEIGDLSLALSDMTEALYRQIDAIDSFAADVAHELKNPLSSLRSAAESLSRTDKPDIRERLLAIIAEDVRRLDRLITDISDASRLDADLTRSRMEPVDLGLLVAMLVDANRTREDCGQKTILFQEPKPGTMMVRGLESRLAQVIANLLENAISFSPDGGTIRVSLSRKGARLELLVEDEGPGLPEGAAQRIFERFYSERPEPEAFGTHSGLGLSISKQIVEAHKGQISASNRSASPDGDTDTPPTGARFCVSMPRL